MSSVTHTPPAATIPASLSSAFDFQPRTRVLFGGGTFAQLGRVANELAAKRILLVTDPGLQYAGHSQHAVDYLHAARLEVFVFDQVAPNPTTKHVDRCVQFARPLNVDTIIGLGGGSSLDCAKGANFLLTNGGRMQDYKGVGKAKKPMLPMIAVPTTSGTGSEAQSFAVIADAETHMKMPCGDPKAACKVAILDPELTVTMPRSVAAATGIDAMTHAIESYVTTKRNFVSQMFARNAWRLLSRAFPTVLTEPENLEARGQMQLGAHLAGAAIENSMLGATHAAANPLTAHFETIHGHAVGLLLPHVIQWNAEEVGSLYHDLAVAAGWSDVSDSVDNAVDCLRSGFTELVRQAGAPTTLAEAVEPEISETLLQTLSEEASQQWTGTFNPRTMNAASYREIYRNAM